VAPILGVVTSNSVRSQEGASMRIMTGLLCLLLGSVCGYAQSQTGFPGGPSPHERVMAWPPDWSSHVGQTVTLEGTAVDAKLGALLQGQESAIWIDDLRAWPEGFYSGHGQGKRLRVTGMVIKRDDLPVFVQKPGAPPRAGMPVQSEEELDKAKWRYLLKGAKWIVLE
jgi:hypothetical protein